MWVGAGTVLSRVDIKAVKLLALGKGIVCSATLTQPCRALDMTHPSHITCCIGKDDLISCLHLSNAGITSVCRVG